MRPLPYLAIAITLLVAACERQPVAPNQALGPQFQAAHSEVTDIFDLVDDPADCTANPRIGEVVLETGHIAVVVRTTTASSGNVNVTGFMTYDPSNYMVGQTSGRVWTIDAARTHPFFSDNVHGAGESFQAVSDEYWISANGVQLVSRVNTHVTMNANGTVAVERPLVYECIGG